MNAASTSTPARPSSNVRAIDDITSLILRESIAIHRAVGPGLFEHAYELILADALLAAGLTVERQVPVPIRYRERTIADGYRIDLLVEGQVVVEIKSVEKLAPVYTQQVLTYLRFGGYRVGMILNFSAPTMVDGVKRVVNGFTDEVPLRVASVGGSLAPEGEHRRTKAPILVISRARESIDGEQ